MATKEELYQSIISKYPQYTSISKEELIPSILRKYPSYQKILDTSELSAPDKPGIMKRVFEIPSAAVRSAIQGKGYTKGALHPEKVKTFQEIALDEVNKMLPEKSGVMTRYITGTIPSAVGLAADIATNPAEMALSLAGGMATKAIAPTKAGQAVGKFMNKPRYIRPTGKDALKLAEEKAVKLFDPSLKSLQDAGEIGLETPRSLTQSLPYVKKSKTYEDLLKNVRKPKIEMMQKRNALIRNKNYDVLAEDYLKKARASVEAMRKDPSVNPTEISRAEAIIERYASMKPRLSRVQTQAEKVRLQNKTEKLIKKRNMGQPTDVGAVEQQTLDDIRFGLKEMAEGGDPRVRSWNEGYSALNETEKLARRQMNLARKSPDPTLLERIPVVKDVVSMLTKNRPYSMQWAVEAMNREPSLAKKTAEIAKLYQRSRIGMPEPSMTPTSNAFVPVLQRAVAPNRKMLPELTEPGASPLQKARQLAAMSQEVQPMIRRVVPQVQEALPAQAGIEMPQHMYRGPFESAPIYGEGFTAVPKEVGQATLAQQKMQALKNYLEWNRNKQMNLRFGRVGD